jgi:hypothetical protein
MGLTRNGTRRRLSFPCIAFFLTLAMVGPRLAAADTLTVTWDRSDNPKVLGYKVYVGPKPGSYTGSHEVSSATYFIFSDAVPGQQYCFAVAAYVSGPVEGKRSSDICGYSNAVPFLASPGGQSTPIGQEATLQLNGSDPLGEPVTYGADNLPPGLSLTASTGLIGGTPTTAGIYNVVATVSDGVLSASRSFSWTIKSLTEKTPTTDTTAPTISITTPTINPTYATSGSSLTVSGTATDTVGVASVSWTNDRGGSGTATGTSSWSILSAGLQSGTNVITVSARDAAGNVGRDVLTVTYTPPPDKTSPTITIVGPTASATLATTTATLAMSGTATDAVGVTQVSWRNDRGGTGTAIGTTNWSIASVPLQRGSNVITVTARDAAGNQDRDQLTVTYSEPTVLTLANLKASLSAPQPVGATIMWSTEVTGGTAPYHYKWWLHDGTQWTVLQDWTPVSWYVWTPTRANSAYRVGVWVRKSTSTADMYDNPLSNGSASFPISPATGSAPITLVSLNADQVAPRPLGTSITWTAAATGGTGALHYKWWLHDGSKWSVLQDWTSSAIYRWQPTQANLAYRVAVWIRNATSTADAYDNPASNGSVAFPITAATSAQQLLLTSLTADRAAPQTVGTTVTFTATATGGSAPYQYKWWLYDGARWTVLRDWSTSNTYAWKPMTANPAYRVGVWIRNATSSADMYDNPLSNGSVGFAVR